MAQYLAGNEVKAELRASGVKVHQVAMSEIKHLAEGYVLKHPELIAKAKAICAELHQQELVKRERQRQRRIQKKVGAGAAKIFNNSNGRQSRSGLFNKRTIVE